VNASQVILNGTAAQAASFHITGSGAIGGELNAGSGVVTNQVTSSTGLALAVRAGNGTGNGGALTLSAGNAGVANGGAGGNLTLQAGSAVPQGGSGYSNQGPAGAVTIAAGGGYNGVGGNVVLQSGPNSNWSLQTRAFSKVSLQGGALLGGDGATLDVEGAHNGSSNNAPLSYGGNIRLTAGTGYGGNPGGHIILTPGSPNGFVGIGTSTPSQPLSMAGGAYCTGTAWVNASSRELKEDIRSLDDPLPLLEKVGVYRFRYKAAHGTDHRERIGVIAEELPEEVSSPDHRGAPTGELIALSLAANRTLVREVQGLKKLNEEQSHQLKVQAEQLRQQAAQLEALQRRFESLAGKRGPGAE
jgi:hypothetical protein